jgi:predicted polyphosphate/ATP-dependent NAD kinase
MARQRIGLIINPIAGMGGSVGLKGTDGQLAATAKELGAGPIAATRASVALSQLADLQDRVTIFTCSGDMGETVAREVGLETTVVATAAESATTADDTVNAAAEILKHDPELLLFAGGDGTARDVQAVVDDRVAVLGVPSGVKMHSAVFAATARAAGDVARRYLLHADRKSLLQNAEIVDREDNGGSIRIYGIARVPRLSFLVPGVKAAESGSEASKLEGAVRRVAETVSDERISLIGPGSTMQVLKSQLGFEGTALGVDAVCNGHCIANDLNEQGILELIAKKPARIVVTVIGGQGFLFGRGNQQLSPRVIRAVGSENITVVSSLEKLLAIPGQQLLVDSGDEELDQELTGHRQVIVSRSMTVVMPVRTATIED